MPGPGQGKRNQKRKGHDNMKNIATTCAITTTTASTTTNTAATAEIYANDATCVYIATAASSDIAISQPQTFTCEEVQVLLDEASLRGWEEGVEEGLKMGKEKIHENGQKMFEKGQRVGHRLGRKDGLEEGERLAGHGEGLCISKEAHIRELWRGAVPLDEAETQTDPETTTWSHASTQAAPRTIETTAQTNDKPKR
jgi:hypothetical protein